MRSTVFAISGALGVHRLFASINRNRPSVLAFHGVTRDETGNLCNHDGKHLPLPVFTRLMEHIAGRYNAVPLSRIIGWLERRDTLPDRAVAITFDDGYRNVLTNAAPVLSRLGIPATLFVVTDFVFGGRMLWTDRIVSALQATDRTELAVEWEGGIREFPLHSREEKAAADAGIRAMCKSLPDGDRLALVEDLVNRLAVSETAIASAWQDHAPVGPTELAQLQMLGVEVGSHTCSHGIVARFADEQMQRELEESRRLIEEATGRPCLEFSYPNGAVGDFDARTRRRVEEAGFRCAVTTVKRRVSMDCDPFEVPRYILTHRDITLAEFSAEVSGFPSFLRAARNRVTGAPTN